jgi:hypothetical protein
MSSVDEYLATVPEPQRTALERVRRVVRRTVPEVEEATSYGMPASMYRSRPLLRFKVSKNHLGVLPGRHRAARLTGVAPPLPRIRDQTEDALADDSSAHRRGPPRHLTQRLLRQAAVRTAAAREPPPRSEP